MVVHWTQGQRTHSGRSTTQVGAVKTMLCPRLNFLNKAQLEQAGATFDQLVGFNLLPACQAHVDNTRKQIDRAVIQMLALPVHAEDTINQLRFLWCSEPSYTVLTKQLCDCWELKWFLLKLIACLVILVQATKNSLLMPRSRWHRSHVNAIKL